MYGTVSRLQAQVNVTIYSANQSEVEIKCVIDTGFEGFLTLPVSIVETLELPYFMDIKANLADDSNVKTDVHLATILWASSNDSLEWCRSSGSRFGLGSSSTTRDCSATRFEFEHRFL